MAAGTAAKGDPPDAATPTKANCDAPVNITKLSTMVWPTVNPEPMEIAPKEAPKAMAYRPMPAAARTIAPRSGSGAISWGSSMNLLERSWRSDGTRS
jgi:hypothetical protein